MAIEHRAATSELASWEYRLLQTIREWFIVGLAAMTAGITVAGIGGRIAMRISAIAAGPGMRGVSTDAGNRVGEITFGGSVAFVLFTGIFGGLAAGILLIAVRNWLPASGRGLLGGGFLLAVGGTTVVHANRDFLILDPALLNIVMYSGIIVGVGWAAMVLASRIANRFEHPVGRSDYAWLVGFAFALLPSPILFGGFFDDELCQCGDGSPGPLVGVFVVAAFAVTVVDAIQWIRTGRRPQWTRVAGSTAVVGAVAFGVVRYLEEVRAIL